MDALVDLRAGAVVGRDHQRVLRRFCILLRNGCDALVVAVNLMDSALPVKILDCFTHFASRKLLDYLFQFRVFLAHDLFELHRLHTGVLELREGPSRPRPPHVAAGRRRATHGHSDGADSQTHAPAWSMPARIRRAHRAVSRRYQAAVHAPDASVAWMSPCLLRRASAPRGMLARSLPLCSPRPPRLRG